MRKMSSTHSDSERCEARQDYTQVFLERPQDVVTILDKLHRDGESMWPFLLSIPWDSILENPEAWNEMIDSGVPEVLVRILGDPRQYEMLPDPRARRTSSEQADNVSCELAYVINFLSLLATLLWKRNDSSSGLTTATRLCDKFPPVWRMVWRNRDIVLHEKFTSPSGDSTRKNISCLLAFYLSIRGVSWRLHSVEPIETHAAHLAFYCWYNGGLEWMNLPSYISSIVHTKGLAHYASFYEEVIRAVIDPSSFATSVCRVLTHQPATSSHSLASNFILIGLCVQFSSPPLGQSSNGKKSILLAVAKAFQHHVCDGDPGTGESDVLARSVMAIVDCMFKHHRTYTMQEIESNLFDLSFIPAIAQSIVLSHVKIDVDTIETTGFILKMLNKVAREGSRQPALVSSLQHLLRIHWISTLDDIRAARRPPSKRQRPSQDVLASLNDAFMLWKDLGKAFGLDEATERERLARNAFESDVPYSERYLGCFTTDCPCHGRISLHGHMRVCKGCWKAVYCGRRCQARDWERGHREMCNGTNR